MITQWISDLPDHLVVIFFLSTLGGLIFFIFFFAFLPLSRAQKTNTIKYDQLERRITEIQTTRSTAQRNLIKLDDQYLDALDKEFHHSQRRNKGKKKRK